MCFTVIILVLNLIEDTTEEIGEKQHAPHHINLTWLTVKEGNCINGEQIWQHSDLLMLHIVVAS